MQGLILANFSFNVPIFGIQIKNEESQMKSFKPGLCSIIVSQSYH